MCSADQCDKPVKARGWCKRHYSRWWRTGTPEANAKAPTKCTECSEPAIGLLLCRNHYNRWVRTGRPEGVGDGDHYAERRITQRHTLPTRPWLSAETDVDVGVVHMQSWVLVSGIRKLVSGCSLRLVLTAGTESETGVMCGKCVHLLKQHGLIAS